MWPWSPKKQKSSVLGPDLKGKPARPRTKTYSAETGHVYQYLHNGWRYLPEFSGREYVFRVLSNREPVPDVSVRLADEAIAACGCLIGREVLDAEKYALAKLALFATFDRVNEAASLRQPITPTAADMEGFLNLLGRV